MAATPRPLVKEVVSRLRGRVNRGLCVGTAVVGVVGSNIIINGSGLGNQREGKSGEMRTYVKRDFVPRIACTVSRTSKTEGRCTLCSRSIEAGADA